MAQDNSERSSTPLVDDEARQLAEALLGTDSDSDVILDLNTGEVDLSGLPGILDQSFLGRSMSETTLDDTQLRLTISRSVFGRPEPPAPYVPARPMTIKPYGATRLSEGTDTMFPAAASAQVLESENGGSAGTPLDSDTRTLRVEPTRSITAGGSERRASTLQILIVIFAIGLVGALASTAVVQLREESDPVNPALPTTLQVDETVPSTAPATTLVPTTQSPVTQPPTTQPPTTQPPTTVSNETILTVPDVSFPRPSWAPDSVAP